MFECPECGHRHDEPGDARLGHVVVCLACTIVVEFTFARSSARAEFLPAA